MNLYPASIFRYTKHLAREIETRQNQSNLNKNKPAKIILKRTKKPDKKSRLDHKKPRIRFTPNLKILKITNLTMRNHIKIILSKTGLKMVTKRIETKTNPPKIIVIDQRNRNRMNKMECCMVGYDKYLINSRIRYNFNWV